MTIGEAIASGNRYMLVGADPGSGSSAFVLLDGVAGVYADPLAWYIKNTELTDHFVQRVLVDAGIPFGGATPAIPVFLAYERLGNQGAFVGEEVFETAAMGGEIRRAFRPFVSGIYALRGSDWAHGLTGVCNAKIPLVYAESCAFFQPTGGGSNPYKGTMKQPGPLWDFHAAGKFDGEDSKVVHLKEAMGCALGLTRVRSRCGKDPEMYRRP